MWIRLEDDFFQHPKVRSVSDLARLFHIEKMCYCGMWLTDGRVPLSEIRGKRQSGYTDELVKPGLWHPTKNLQTTCPECWAMVKGNPGTGWVIHDYLKYQLSKERVEANRVAARERKDRKDSPSSHELPANVVRGSRTYGISGRQDNKNGEGTPSLNESPEEQRRREIEESLH